MVFDMIPSRKSMCLEKHWVFTVVYCLAYVSRIRVFTLCVVMTAIIWLIFLVVDKMMLCNKRLFELEGNS